MPVYFLLVDRKRFLFRNYLLSGSGNIASNRITEFSNRASDKKPIKSPKTRKNKIIGGSMNAINERVAGVLCM